MIIPRATLRLQLHEGYTLNHARKDLPYFARLGVSHLYLSPISQSSAGSTHGYDVVDHGRVDSVRGGETALRHLSAEARHAGMGLLLDIVPNHMATDPDNAWWWDVLKRGQESAWADAFDIDWDMPLMPGKLLAPFLGKQYADALSCGDILLRHDDERGFYVTVHDVPYPLAPASLEPAGIPGGTPAVLAAHDPAGAQGRQRLHALLERQHYRLAWWRCAAEIINWRRFFEVSSLIGVRVERERIFQAVHRLPLQLYAEGVIDGLRIDHVDGLALPLDYCRRLRAAMAYAQGRRPGPQARHEPWIVVEKILAPGETFDARWAVSGTTGYDFTADVGAVLHDGAGEARLRSGWGRIAGDDRPVEAWVVDARREMLERHFVAERGKLLDTLAGLAQKNPATRDWTRAVIGRMLDALLSHFPVYRTYVEDGPRSAADQRWFDHALRGAMAAARHDDGLHAALLPLLDQWLGAVAPASDDARSAVRRFQQLTPPLAAKSLEDTTFYRYGALLSRNEVGSDPAVFAIPVQGFHENNMRRAARSPWGLLATATHDHKRGEDLRARLAALSEIPDEWLGLANEWLRVDAGNLPVKGPSMAFRYMLMQMLVGAWPTELSADDPPGVAAYLERVEQWAIKALREGKQLSSWFEPDSEREANCAAWLYRMAPGGPCHSVLREIESFARRLEPAAIANGLAQVVLRMTCPGIPDLYQGTEFRDFSLVDPDNRRAVDFDARDSALAHATGGASGARTPFEAGRWPAAAWSDGRVKQALIAFLMALRIDRSAAFESGYRPLAVTGLRKEQVLAFCRGEDIVVVAGVKGATLLQRGPDGMPVTAPEHWSGHGVALPSPSEGWRDVLRGRRLCGAGREAELADVLAGLPLAVLCRDPG